MGREEEGRGVRGRGVGRGEMGGGRGREGARSVGREVGVRRSEEERRGRVVLSSVTLSALVLISK